MQLKSQHLVPKDDENGIKRSNYAGTPLKCIAAGLQTWPFTLTYSILLLRSGNYLINCSLCCFGESVASPLHQ